ncbi:conserved hypothetical protein [Ricinus communis]|uniref:Uncharacterized protein n=1 Tax=Ricinus communis TaxID=3988 RepID=B9S0Y4_RICCO|nr:conserved hypothetical protein [Ricinus communis]
MKELTIQCYGGISRKARELKKMHIIATSWAPTLPERLEYHRNFGDQEYWS